MTELVGKRAEELGGEAGLMEAVLTLAERQGTAGRSPFAALVVRDGVVVGAGVNRVEDDLDPSAHAEVVAIRDAAGSAEAATLYTSCEPCALCRTVAHAAGVAEMVYAAGKELIPPAMGRIPDDVVALIDAVSTVLPGQTRATKADIPAERRARPFTRFVESGAGR
ncbi:MAG TPA: deaminase [Mycobacteriales bacterium]|nr:deaminase [Mycobacteriales bacterium]